MHFAEMIMLAGLVAHFNPARILEFGTSNGVTAAMLKLNAPAAQVITVDIQPDYRSTYTAKCLRGRNHVGSDIPLLGLSDNDVEQVLIDPSLPLHHFKLLDQVFDFILIDGDHTMEAVKKDTDFALSHFSGRGAILWHDYYITPSYIKTPLVRGVYPVVQSLMERADVVSKNWQIRHLLGTSFAILSEGLPVGQLVDINNLEGTIWDKNIRVKHLYGQ